jgi:hypothetical protein
MLELGADPFSGAGDTWQLHENIPFVLMLQLLYPKRNTLMEGLFHLIWNTMFDWTFSETAPVALSGLRFDKYQPAVLPLTNVGVMNIFRSKGSPF